MEALRAAAAILLLALPAAAKDSADGASGPERLVLKSHAPSGSLYMTVRADGFLVVREELEPDAGRKPLKETRRVPVNKAREILALAGKNGFMALEPSIVGRGARPEGGDTVWSLDLRAGGRSKRVQVQGEMPRPFAELVERITALYGKPLPGP